MFDNFITEEKCFLDIILQLSSNAFLAGKISATSHSGSSENVTLVIISSLVLLCSFFTSIQEKRKNIHRKNKLNRNKDAL
tara:strand:+ start:45 stop:284 length:240 start_codon:yes stop_codon:yes gene_type:complete